MFFFSLFHCLRCSLTSIYLSLPQNQVQREIKYAMTSLPWISLPTVALFFAEVRGYSKLYDAVDESPLGMLKKVSSSVLLTFPVRLSQGVEFLMLQWCVFRLARSFPEYDFLPVFHWHVYLLDSPLPTPQAYIQGEFDRSPFCIFVSITMWR